ncbi:MAG: GNAT family N-acetyltransferase [Candidatus Egerieousia sp.]
MNTDIKIIPAQPTDKETLADIFMRHIEANREYISHGEIQMGVGVAVKMDDGSVRVRPADNGRQMWIKYITEKLNSSEAAVYKAVVNDEIIGFCIADIEEDGADPFGMVCDVLVKEGVRGGGIGGRLLQTAIDWFKSKGISEIYLESGKNNHDAHRFFEKRGFVKMSEIFRLS